MKSDNLIGEQLDEYRLEALLGRGGMARVYRGLDVRLRRYVAVKVIDTDFRGDPQYRRRFEREAQTIGQLDHPHIVRVYRYGEARGVLYMAMQYMEGADLHTVLNTYRQEGQFMEAADAARIVREIGQALDYAHGRGVIHRDIKPGNIMLDRQGQAVLTDFGLALLTEDGTRGEVFGTPHYMSPEHVASSANAVPQSDLYGLGVILYEMLTGTVPFEAPQPMEVALMQVNDPPPPPRQRRPDLSPAVEEVILRALHKRPEGRYRSGAALADALGGALAADRITAGPPSTLSHLTIPERVANEMAEHPLPPLPADDTNDAPRRIALAPLLSPLANRPTRPWLYAGGCAGLALLALLLCAAAYFLFLRDAPGSEVEAGLDTRTAEASVVAATTLPGQPTPTRAPAASLAPATPAGNPLPPADVTYELLAARRGDDSLFVVNVGGPAVPVAPLVVTDREDRAISGPQWLVSHLESGACVTAWKDVGNPRPPDVTCNPVGAELRLPARDVFWNSTIEVYYDGVLVGRCGRNESSCRITVVISDGEVQEWDDDDDDD